MKFEYKILEFQDAGIPHKKILEDQSKEFNALGKEGWKLVSVIPVGFAGMVGSSFFTRAFFKRQIK